MALFTVNYSGGYGKYYEFKAEAYEQKADNYISTNQTTVVVDIYLRRTNISSNGAYNLNGTAWSITIDGTTTNGTNTWDTRNSSDWKWLGSASKLITHNSDGSKEITISASHTGNSASGSSKMGNASGSNSFTLTKIPRASSILANDANIESATTINISRADNSFTHTITYSFSRLTGTIATKTTSASVGWTIPSSFYAKIPNSKTGVVTLTCTTYSGDSAIGTSSTTFTVTASEEKCKPTLTATLIDSNSTTVALTGSNTKLVKYKSTAKITPTATAKNSATIKTITVNGTTVSGSYIQFTNVQSTTFKVVATDSRGYSYEITLKPTIVNYIPLTVTAEFYRIAATSSTVKVKYSGNYFNASFGSVSNSLTITWKYRKKGTTSWTNGGTLTPTKSGNTYSGDVSLGTTFDYQTAYEFIIYASDKLINLNAQQPLKKGEPVYDWGVDQNGNNYLFVNGNLYAKGNLQVYGNGEINEIDFENLQLKPTTLYNNSSGTVGTVTLSETSANFSYLEIFFGVHGSGWSVNSVKVSSPNGKQCSLSAVTFDNSDSSNLAYINNAKLMKISGTNITVNSYERMFKYYKDSNVYIDTENNIYIYKVIGYR